MSPHGDTGDIHDEPQGSAAGRTAQRRPDFTRAPADDTAAWSPAPRDLAAVLSCRYHRRVAHDNTVRLGRAGSSCAGAGPTPAAAWSCASASTAASSGFADGHCLATQPASAAEFILRPPPQPGSDRRPRRRAAPHLAAAAGRLQVHRSPVGPESPSVGWLPITCGETTASGETVRGVRSPLLFVQTAPRNWKTSRQ
jgi:hypothetical protein